MSKDAVDIEEHVKEDSCTQHVKERRLKTPRLAPAVTRRKCNARNFVAKPSTYFPVVSGGMCGNRNIK